MTYLEIGNEQGLDDILLGTFVNISTAMEQRVAELGLSVQFHYVIGHNLDAVC